MKVSVVIPCYKVKSKILSVIEAIGDEVVRIYVVDDKCPESSGQFVKENSFDPRVQVLFHEKNLGVGGAVTTGYKAAIHEGMDIVVKIDGDGQMNPKLLHSFISPILAQQYDYTKGNRFYRLGDVQQMPIIRLFGNAVLSFFNKVSTGYWHLFDPTNGYTAISVACLKNLELDKVSQRYFFESDLLFRLGIIGANVKDIPMKAVYDDEESNLKIQKIILPFLKGHIENYLKRLFYDYVLRDFSIATVSLVAGVSLTTFGTIFGIYHWCKAIEEHSAASSGTVMLAALPVIIGTQLVLNYLNYDINKSRSKSRATFSIK